MLTLLDNLFPWFGNMLELGGDILLAIVMVALLISTMLVERLSYLYWVFPSHRNSAIDLWQHCHSIDRWRAQQFRNLIIARLNRQLKRNIGLVRTLIKLCPLLGLLGTVLGMLEVFDAVAATGATNPRATASGVSKATVTTMAGMVVAIAGMLMISFVNRQVAKASDQVNQSLQFESEPVTTE